MELNKPTIRFLCFAVLVTSGLAAKSSLVFSQTIDDLVIMTENYPPYNFEKDGKPQGIAVDLMVSMLAELGAKQSREDIRLLPWARGYRITLNKKNTCLFSTTRTEERENLFKWVGPIISTSIGLIARKDKDVAVQSLTDLENYRVGVVRSDIGEQLLVNAGISLEALDRIGGTNATSTSITKLNKGRIDIWSYETNVAFWEMKAAGVNIEEYETVYMLKEGELFFACHKDTPQELLQQLQEALDALKTQGIYQQVVDRYTQ